MKKQTILKGNLSLNDKDTGYQFLEWTDETVKNFWNYENLFPHNYFTYQVGENLASFIKNFTFSKKELLDYGAGLGFLERHLLQHNFNVTALEFSDDSIKLINEKYANCVGFKGAYSFDTISELNEKYDIITLVEVIEHLDEKYLELTFDNIKSSLKPGGILVITTPNDEDLYQSLIFSPETKKVYHRWQHITNWSVDTITDFLSKKGFFEVKCFQINLSNAISLKKIFKDPPNLFQKGILFIKRKMGLNQRSNYIKQPHLVVIAKL